jgi:hypothetical protein
MTHSGHPLRARHPPQWLLKLELNLRALIVLKKGRHFVSMMREPENPDLPRLHQPLTNEQFQPILELFRMISEVRLEVGCDSQGERCRRLFEAILRQALSDCFGSRKQQSGEDGGSRAQARTFLFAETGPWKHSRELICSLSGVDPDYFSERVRAMADVR